ncbi:YkvA family protein [Marinobacter sp. X15-166B]|uniref:YkvA family protein n=1 Tax=Marinobacter sp. X15-166B TaxID=1897620 RepID=UPI00085C6556|nr:DUF1232 domain-containing protein [Marinobacter sp. X15-166B]OEY66257.1 hypothetical protein BG841_07165 [Marinobacter sp. X15-166B]
MRPFTTKQATDELHASANRVTGADLEALLARQHRIEERVKNSGRLARFGTDIQLMFALLRDYWHGHYRTVPWKAIAAVAGALLYLLNPLDLIPDLIPGFGLLDDAGVVAVCLTLVEADLFRYAAWREQRGLDPTP